MGPQSRTAPRAGQGFKMRAQVIIFFSYLFLLDLQLFMDRMTVMSVSMAPPPPFWRHTTTPVTMTADNLARIFFF